MKVKIIPSPVSGSLTIPASKSLSHRAVICAGLAKGISTIHHLADSRDLQATLECMEQLGASISKTDEETLRITGCNPADLNHSATLNAFESGSTLRFLIPVAAAASVPVTFDGQPTLLSRPMGIYADLFERQNLTFEQSGQDIVVQGPLQAGLFSLPGNVSSQFISGLLLAAPLLDGGSAIAVIPPYESKSYTNLTVSMMEQFGIRIDQPTDHGYEIAAGQSYQPQTITVESDWSQAAFFAVLAAIQNPLTLQGLNPDSLQGDKVILDLLEKAGARADWQQDTLTISPAPLKGITIDLSDCPDLGPILCVLASYMEGTTRIEHASRLRYKESDRIAAMEQELKKWNVDISSDEDSITITGKSSYKMPEPVIMDSHNDHRIAMAMAVFTLCAQSEGIIENAQAVNKSYPNFFEDLKKIHADVITETGADTDTAAEINTDNVKNKEVDA